MSHTLSESGVFMGDQLNKSGDLLPPKAMYEACRVMAKHVVHLGGLRWDFSALHTMPIDPEFTDLIEIYLKSVLDSDEPNKGWKIPETTLVLPWIVRMFPEARYIYWVRDPRDNVLGNHLTDDLADFGVPYEETDDLIERRSVSWHYQFEIMRQTPSPKHRIDVRFEDFILRQDETLGLLEEFLGIPMAKIPVRTDSIGRWRSEVASASFEGFPCEALYNGPWEMAQA
jgi:hypothetical protein